VTYKDPLHIPYAELVVWHNGKENMMLNKSLLDQLNRWTSLDLLKELHSKRLHIEDEMEEINSEGLPKDKIKNLHDQWTENQYKLQKAWGFQEDGKKHRFWDIPACKCPKMDNDERYPTGYYVISEGCKLHWTLLEWRKEVKNGTSRMDHGNLFRRLWSSFSLGCLPKWARHWFK